MQTRERSITGRGNGMFKCPEMGKEETAEGDLKVQSTWSTGCLNLRPERESGDRPWEILGAR